MDFAAASMAFTCGVAVVGSHRAPTLILDTGVTSFTSSSHFPISSGRSRNTPVTFPPQPDEAPMKIPNTRTTVSAARVAFILNAPECSE